MHKRYAKTFNFLRRKSKAEGTWDNYKSKHKAWRKFCSMWNLNPNKRHPQNIYCYFAIWRYETTKNKYSTLTQDLSAVFSLYNHNSMNDHINRKDFHILGSIMKGIKKDPSRQSEPTNPIRNILLLKIINKYKKFTYKNLLWKAMTCFAKGFALRCGEYTPATKSPTNRTLQWNHLNFHKYNNKKYLSVTLRITKTNQTYKTEILTRQCLCSNKKLKPICSVCIMRVLKRLAKIKFNNGPKDYVFKNSDGSLVTGEEFRKELKSALKFIGIKNPRYPLWRPHSLRHGELTDLIAVGTPIVFVRKYARHKPKSETTFDYIQLETNEEASLVAKKYKKYFSKALI